MGDRPAFFALVPPPRPRKSPSSSCSQPSTSSQPAPAATASSELRIATWNVGLRGLAMMCSPNSSDALGPADCHGIRRKQSYGGLGQLLRAVDADIVCLQEVKLKELGAPERALALEEGWDSYFSLCRVRNASTSHGRYSGVATFCRTACRPRLAEEGVSGALAPSAGGGVGHTARVAEAFAPSRLHELDGEGRAVITVHGDLAIFNLYVPSLGKTAG